MHITSRCPDNARATDIAYTVYDITIKRGIRYQPHPAFARNADGRPVYQNLQEKELEDKHELSDFKQTGTRELNAADFVYQIKRLAHPRLHSPILGLMEDYIVGLKDYAEQLRQVNAGMVKEGKGEAWLNLTQYPLAGVTTVDDYTYG